MKVFAASENWTNSVNDIQIHNRMFLIFLNLLIVCRVRILSLRPNSAVCRGLHHGGAVAAVPLPTEHIFTT
jgi:hypothetical protein